MVRPAARATACLSPRAEVEHMPAPRRHVQVEAAGSQGVSIALVFGRAEQVSQSPVPPRKLVVREVDVALALARAEIDRDQQLPTVGSLPGECNELAASWVPVPRWPAFAECPPAAPGFGALENCEQAAVEVGERRVGRLDGAADQVDRASNCVTLELALVEEAQTGDQERQRRRGLVDLGREGRRGPRLVVVLEEPCRAVLE